MSKAENEFSYDVFLSYSSKDKLLVHALEPRLRTGGLRVWIDHLEIAIGDSIPAKIEQGLEQSRALVLCMSKNFFAVDWPTMESQTFRFRDPLNREGRFIPVRLDDAQIPGSLGQFRYIDWPSGMDGIDDVADQILSRVSELVRTDLTRQSDKLLREPGRSERGIVAGVLDAVDSLLKKRPSSDAIAHRSILAWISDILVRHRGYELLRRLKNEIESMSTRTSVTVEELQRVVIQFRKELSDAAKRLAANGAKVIEDNDSVLLYAFSESVALALEKWLSDNPTARVELFFCQCLWKIEEGAGRFREAIFWADRITHPNAHIVFTTDAGAGELLRHHRVNKVLFGVRQWQWRSVRRACFTNTPGTLAIAAVADKFEVPIFVLAESKKSYSELTVGAEEAARSSRHDSPPRQTAHGRPIAYVDPGADEIDSSEFAFVLITEDGEFSCTDFDLRKRNRVVVDSNKLSVTKKTAEGVSARSERIALDVLNRRKRAPKYQVPPIVAGQHDWAGVRMGRKCGVRVHDFVATINELTRSGARAELLGRAEEFRNKSREWALQDVRTWQSPAIQEPLRQAFGYEAKPYEFTRRLKEAVSYIWSCRRSNHPVAEGIAEELAELGSRLESRARVLLRDATLKNQILEIESWLQSDGDSYLYPGADVAWFDQRTAEVILSRIPNEISWEQVRDHIWHVDFELACRLCPPEDDFIHVLALEVFGLNYSDIIQEVRHHLPGEGYEQFHETVLFRSIRAWARRISYLRERPDIYMARYRHESLSYYHQLALSAAEHCSGRLGNNLIPFIQESAQLMDPAAP